MPDNTFSISCSKIAGALQRPKLKTVNCNKPLPLLKAAIGLFSSVSSCANCERSSGFSRCKLHWKRVRGDRWPFPVVVYCISQATTILTFLAEGHVVLPDVQSFHKVDRFAHHCHSVLIRCTRGIYRVLSTRRGITSNEVSIRLLARIR